MIMIKSVTGHCHEATLREAWRVSEIILYQYLLHLIRGQLIIPPIIQRRGAPRFMRRHLLRKLSPACEPASIINEIFRQNSVED
jgi:hypothetical protein